MFCKQRARSNRKTEAKQIIRAVVRKAETNKKKSQQSAMQKAQRFLFVLYSKEPVLRFNKAHFLQSSWGEGVMRHGAWVR